MESLTQRPEYLAESHSNSGFHHAAMGRSAVSSDMSAETVDIPERIITAGDMEQVKRTLYADLIATELYEHGDIADSSNTLRSLLDRLDMEDAQKGRKIKVESAVRTLSDAGLVRARKMLMKSRDGAREYEVFAPLRKPGNFVVLNRDNYSIYQSWKNQNND